MADDEGTNEDGAGTKDKGDAEMQRRLTEANEQAAEAKVLTKLMKDPEFAQLYAAKASGKPVKMVPVDGVQPKQEQQQEAAPNFDEMNEQQKMQYMVTQAVKGLEPVLESKLKPLSDTVTSLQRAHEEGRNNVAVQQVQAARQKYSDFEDHVPAMQKLASDNPNLDVDQLYVLATVKAGKPVKTDTRTSSERPVFTNARTPKAQKQIAPGKASMFEALRASATKQVRSRVDVDSDDQND